MTTTSEPLTVIRNRLAAPLARLHECVGRRRDFERLEVPRSSALTVVCDDGEWADLDVVDVLTAAGVRGVFAVSPDLVGRPGFTGYPQLAQLRDAGHEIAFHGTTHEPFTRFRRQVDLSAAVCDGMKRFADEGFFPTTLVYPYGANNHRVRAWVAPLFDCAFTTWHGANVGATNRYAIRRMAFGAYAGRWTHDEAAYRRCIERAATTACWPAWMLHPGAAGHTREHHAMLARLLAHARSVGVPIRTAREHLADAALPSRDAIAPAAV
jgi:peptidoglycan/xylan/chitin deacetylase (PgdA/CDA1 family)